MQSAYRAGVSQLARRPLRYMKYRDGAIVGQETDDVGAALIEKVEVQIPDWSAWAVGGGIGLVLGLIICGSRRDG